MMYNYNNADIIGSHTAHVLDIALKAVWVVTLFDFHRAAVSSFKRHFKDKNIGTQRG